MTKDEIIEMARHADLTQWDEPYQRTYTANVTSLWRFAKLVAAKEREAIKALAEKELLNTSALMSMPQKSSAAWNILQAIRARGEA